MGATAAAAAAAAAGAAPAAPAADTTTTSYWYKPASPPLESLTGCCKSDESMTRHHVCQYANSPHISRCESSAHNLPGLDLFKTQC